MAHFQFAQNCFPEKDYVYHNDFVYDYMLCRSRWSYILFYPLKHTCSHGRNKFNPWRISLLHP